MSAWEVGDVAVCVDAHLRDNPEGIGLLRRGNSYTVSGIHPAGGLWLAELPTKCAFYMDRFRKITPDKAEPCEEEFVVLLNRVTA